MGYAIWALLSAVAATAAYAAAARLTWPGGSLERAMAAVLFFVTLLLAAVHLTALPGVLSAGTLGTAALALSAAVLWASAWQGGVFVVRAAARHDAGAPRRLWDDVRARGELAAFVLPVAAVALCVPLFIAWRFPSWSWDCVWYHLSTTNLVVQEGALRWFDTHIYYVNSYPKFVELLSVWNVIFPHHTRLDDLAQLPFLLLGALAVAALARRGGAAPGLSASLGAMWVCLPAVVLQVQTTHADIAGGALLVTAFYFLTHPHFPGFARAMTFLALGLYAGTKVTGLFHLALLSPLLGLRLGQELWGAKGHRGRTLGFIGLSMALALALGAGTYLANVVHTGNPFYPARLTVPLLGLSWDGPLTVEQIAGPPAFFGAPGAFGQMTRGWFLRSANYYPDVREGPFGLLFPWVALPALGLAVLVAPFTRRRWHVLSLALLLVLAVLVPAAWWGRFVLAAPAAALAAVAVVHGWLRFRPLQWLFSAALAVLSVESYAHCVPGYRALPTPFATEAEARADQARLRREADWLFTPEAAALREAELRPGAAVAYDDSLSFMGNLWTEDLRNRVVHLPHAGDDADYLARLRALQPQWVSVGAGTRAEQLLRQRPQAFEFLFPQGRSAALMFRVVGEY